MCLCVREEKAKASSLTMDDKDPSRGEKKDGEKNGEEKGDNQLEDESREEMVKKGAVGRRNAVVDIPKEAVEGGGAKS